mmetsp:Transcript_35027/g.110189  ORF Transcript_35027/g.110189 Transcript_35027/m.110189 type:complete len:83 (+) Transcript_35027:122-370(+)
MSGFEENTAPPQEQARGADAAGAYGRGDRKGYYNKWDKMANDVSGPESQAPGARATRNPNPNPEPPLCRTQTLTCTPAAATG